jgi:hypothetical protein
MLAPVSPLFVPVGPWNSSALGSCTDSASGTSGATDSANPQRLAWQLSPEIYAASPSLQRPVVALGRFGRRLGTHTPTPSAGSPPGEAGV